MSCGGKAGGSAGPKAGAAGVSGDGPVAQPDSPMASKTTAMALENLRRAGWCIPAPRRQISTLDGLSGQRKHAFANHKLRLPDPLTLTPRREGNISQAAFGTPEC